MGTMSIVVLVSIVLVIVLGFITKINTGFFALAAAYIIGSFLMNLSPSALLAMWPLKIFFVLFGVSLFYNFSVNNGTMEKLALNIIYKYGKRPNIFPFILFVVAYVIAAMGPALFGTIAMLCPVAYVICEKIKMNKLLGALAVFFGALGGGGWITSSAGAVIREIIASAGFPDEAVRYTLNDFIGNNVMAVTLFLIYYIALKGYKLRSEEIVIEKPEPYNKQQKQSIILICSFILILMFPYLLGFILPEHTVVIMLQKYIDVAFVSIILAIIASLLKVGDEREALARVPWGTTIMISGVGVLIALAVKTGLIEALAAGVSSTGNQYTIPLLMATLSGILSLFSSTIGVVLPTFYPMVKGIALSTGIHPAILLTAIHTAAGCVGISPFSSGGSLSLASLNEKDAKTMFNRFLVLPLINLPILLILWTLFLLIWNL